MRLTRFSDNALRCLMYLGLSDRSKATVGEVARSMSMSEDHLLKVIKRLSQLGLVQTIRGRNGGLRLARSPEDINIAEVVRATEDNLAIVPCFDSQHANCPISSVCRLAPAIEEALGSFFSTLQRYTLADLVRERHDMRRVTEGRPTAGVGAQTTSIGRAPTSETSAAGAMLAVHG